MEFSKEEIIITPLPPASAETSKHDICKICTLYSGSGGNCTYISAGRSKILIDAGKSARTLLISGLIGGLYDFIVATFGAWSETISTTVTHIGQTIADRAKLVLKLNTGAAVLGLGYIVGLKYAFIISAE